MSQFCDSDDVIAAEIPDDLVEELIRGAFEPELPAELVLVGRVLRAAHGPIPGEDRAREAEVVEAMITAMRVTPLAAARRSSRGRRRVLVAVTAAVSVLGVGGVAAAAGGLPTPIQSFVHDSLTHIGVSVPSDEDDSTPPVEPEPTDDAGVPPGPANDTPGNSDSAPGQTGETPGQSGETPGQSGAPPPGQSGATPGQSGEPPGHSGEPPGKSGDAPGQSGETPGQSDVAPGQPSETPGQSGETPGQSGATPGPSESAPDNPKK